eukprot:PITA_02534
MMIKLDLSKAFDRLNWDYLKSALVAFGFNNRWIQWVQDMIATPNFSILLNGMPTSTFNATRGLRKGDPLFPFFFIIVAEGLVSLREVKGMKKILDLFMEASGTQINKDKSFTFFFDTMGNVKSFLTTILGFCSGDLPANYLGTKIALNPLKMENWHHTIEKPKNRFANWSFQTFNIAGRTMLLRSVLQAIPIYHLSTTTVPKGAYTKMVEIFKEFIWGGPQQQRKWASISWKRLTKNKAQGGLGLRDP